MGPLSTRASTSAQPETLQRVSSVLDTIQHPTSFLPSAHFVFAEMSFVGFTLTSDFLQSKGYRSYQKKRLRELSSYCFHSVFGQKEFFLQLLGNLGEFLYLDYQPDFFNFYPSDYMPAMIVLANELYSAAVSNETGEALELWELFYLDFSRNLFHQLDWWLVHCFYSRRSTVQDFLFTSAFDPHKDKTVLDMFSYQLTGYILDMLYYYVSSNGQETGCLKAAFKDQISQKEQELFCLKKELTSLKSSCDQLKQENFSYKNQLTQELSKTIGDDERLTGLKRELEESRIRLKKLSQENEKLVQKKAELIEENDLLKQLFIERNSDGSDVSCSCIDYSKPYLFVGGHYSTVDKLRLLFPNSRFIFTEKEVPKLLDLTTCNGVFVFTSFVSHSLYNKTKSMSKSAGIPFVHINHSGLKAAIDEINTGFAKTQS